MFKISLLVSTAALALLAAPALAAVQLPTDFVQEQLVAGLDQPTAMAMLPGGRILVTEQRTGNVRLIVNGALSPKDPILTIPDVNAVGNERGLLGIAADPRWPEYPYVYLVYTRTGNAIRLVRYGVWGEVADPQGDTLTFAFPLTILDDLPDNDANHNGACLRFAPDGMLLMSLGDDRDPCASADSTTLRGQILRLRVDGLPAPGAGVPAPKKADITPADNPFVHLPDTNARLVHAYGLRNPWRFHIDPVFGTVYSADVGEETFEEINEVFPGDFLGWPWREGNIIMYPPGCTEPGGEGANNYKDPIVSVGHGLSPIALLSGPMYRPVAGASHNWPLEYQGAFGSLFYAEYYAGWLRRLKKQSGIWLPAQPVPGQPNATDWATGLTSPADFLIDEDGNMLWLAQFNESYGPGTGSLNRIRYAPPVGVPRPHDGAVTLRGAPNPFTMRTELAFVMGQAGHAVLDVFDVTGRRVRRLFDGWADPGTVRLVWDGRDEAGRSLPPGLYMGRLVTPDDWGLVRLMRIE